MSGHSTSDEHGPSGGIHDAAAEEVRLSRAKKLRRRLRGHTAELVTDAHQSPEENRLHREKVYAWLQGVRIPFLLASGVAYVWWHSIVLSAILFAISIPLPWIAVVIANGVGERRDPRQPAVYKPALAREYQAMALEQQQAAALPQADTATVIDHEEATKDDSQ